MTDPMQILSFGNTDYTWAYQIPCLVVNKPVVYEKSVYETDNVDFVEQFADMLTRAILFNLLLNENVNALVLTPGGYLVIETDGDEDVTTFTNKISTIIRVITNADVMVTYEKNK